jgi:putative peptidoglycan lipid II flippase
MEKKNKLFFVTIILFIFSFFTRTIGFFKQAFVGFTFGAGSITDAFLITNLIPTVIVVDIAMSIKTNYIPIISSMNNSEKEINEFTNKLISFSLVILICLTILLNLFPYFFLKIFSSGFDSTTLEYAVVMLRIISLSIIPTVLIQIFKGYLQHRSKFASTGYYPFILNIVSLIFILFSSVNTFYLLSLGIVIGNYFILFLATIEVFKNGFKHRLNFKFFDKNFKYFLILTIPLMLENFTSSLNLIVDRNFASQLDLGIVTSLAYASSFTHLIFSLVTVPIGTVLYPRISKASGNSDIESISKDFYFFNKLIYLIIIPISLFISFNSEIISKILFSDPKKKKGRST